MRKVFLEDLPRQDGYNGKRIDWKNSIGYKVPFIYDDIDGEVEIVGINKKYILIKYLEKDIFKIFVGDFSSCKLGKLLGKYTKDFKIEIGTLFKDNKRDLIYTRPHTRVFRHELGRV